MDIINYSRLSEGDELDGRVLSSKRLGASQTCI